MFTAGRRYGTCIIDSFSSFLSKSDTFCWRRLLRECASYYGMRWSRAIRVFQSSIAGGRVDIVCISYTIMPRGSCGGLLFLFVFVQSSRDAWGNINDVSPGGHTMSGGGWLVGGGNWGLEKKNTYSLRPKAVSCISRSLGFWGGGHYPLFAFLLFSLVWRVSPESTVAVGAYSL